MPTSKRAASQHKPNLTRAQQAPRAYPAPSLAHTRSAHTQLSPSLRGLGLDAHIIKRSARHDAAPLGGACPQRRLGAAAPPLQRAGRGARLLAAGRAAYVPGADQVSRGEGCGGGCCSCVRRVATHLRHTATPAPPARVLPRCWPLPTRLATHMPGAAPDLDCMFESTALAVGRLGVVPPSCVVKGPLTGPFPCCPPATTRSGLTRQIWRAPSGSCFEDMPNFAALVRGMVA